MKIIEKIDFFNLNTLKIKGKMDYFYVLKYLADKESVFGISNEKRNLEMKQTRQIAQTILVTIVLYLLKGCGSDSENSQPTKVAKTYTNGNGEVVALTFQDDIQPIMEANCSFSGCHSKSSAESGYELETYSGTSAGIGGSISSIEKGSMPPSGYQEVSQQDLDKLKSWMDQGKPE